MKEKAFGEVRVFMCRRHGPKSRPSKVFTISDEVELSIFEAKRLFHSLARAIDYASTGKKKYFRSKIPNRGKE